MAQYLQQPSKNGAAQTIASAVEVCDLATSWPAIFEHLTESAWESGVKRVTSTLMVFSEDGAIKLCLHDRAVARSAWVAGSSLTRALQLLENGLVAGSVEWRRDKPGARK